MLPRRLAQHIRDQNWTAFGIDFVIVVVGVFVGIQAANWNEDRALDRREEIYLGQLLLDLEADAATGERGLQESNDINAAATAFLDVIEGSAAAESVSDAALITYVAQAGYAYIPQAQTTTYDEMISTGALSRIDDLDLKRAITRYYEIAQSGGQWNVLLRDEQFAYRAAIRGVLTREQFAWARAHVRDFEEPRFEQPAFDRDAFLAEVRSRPAIVDSLRSMGAVQQRLQDNSRTMTIRAENLARQIAVAAD